MERRLEQLLRERAGNQCEYCHLPERFSELPFVFDHVIARQHGGPSTLENLALCCGFCNAHKGPNIAGVDPTTNSLTPLFHPRQHDWLQHFRWNGPVLTALTGVGRVTLYVMAMNDPTQLAVRQMLISEGLFSDEAS